MLLYWIEWTWTLCPIGLESIAFVFQTIRRQQFPIDRPPVMCAKWEHQVVFGLQIFVREIYKFRSFFLHFSLPPSPISLSSSPPSPIPPISTPLQFAPSIFRHLSGSSAFNLIFHKINSPTHKHRIHASRLAEAIKDNRKIGHNSICRRELCASVSALLLDYYVCAAQLLLLNLYWFSIDWNLIEHILCCRSI